MARTIKDSLALIPSSLKNIESSLQEKNVNASNLKLSEVAGKIREIEVKPKTGKLKLRQYVEVDGNSKYVSTFFNGTTVTHRMEGPSNGNKQTYDISLKGEASTELELPVGNYTMNYSALTDEIKILFMNPTPSPSSETIVIEEGKTTSKSVTFYRRSIKCTVILNWTNPTSYEQTFKIWFSDGRYETISSKYTGDSIKLSKTQQTGTLSVILPYDNGKNCTLTLVSQSNTEIKTTAVRPDSDTSITWNFSYTNSDPPNPDGPEIFD